ncbi:MAG: dTDP-4-dehydrorhamnose 3,5-epimerase [Gemmobacter sp.]|nr:dTDP-4-dehydrorhamnose 3,5-epimerase [Gemmobacter sp.]
MLDVKETPLPGVMLLMPRRFSDARGWFTETWNARRMADACLDFAFVQDNHSFSAEPGILRGLHFQKPPRAQDKLVRCSRGAIFDVAVDGRRGSATYGQWTGAELSAENGHQLLVPKGFLHGFVTLVADTEVQYKCTDVYAPDCDGAVLWSSCGIDWPLPGRDPVLSDKDREAQPFADFETPFVAGPQP